jgi:hypothetical protein
MASVTRICPALSFGLQSSGDVDGIADHGVVHDLLRADVADNDSAGVDADT